MYIKTVSTSVISFLNDHFILTVSITQYNIATKRVLISILYVVADNFVCACTYIV